MLRFESVEIPLARRAAYRRVLAILKASGIPFVLGGAVGAALHLGHFPDEAADGDLEVFVQKDVHDAALHVLSAAGFKLSFVPDEPAVRLEYADHVVLLRWGLPHPLGGAIDDAWFLHARRVPFLDLRLRVAPVEELLWLRLAARNDLALADRVADELILAQGASLDWGRLLERLAGLEALVLAKIFYLRHHHPEAARAAVPPSVIDKLLARLNPGSSSSVVLPLR